MGKIEVELSVIEQWYDKLDGAKDPKKACFSVAESMYDFIENEKRKDSQMKSILDNMATPKRTQQGLYFNQIQIGKEYRFCNDRSVKSIFRGARVKITEKKRTRVRGELTTPVIGYPIGTKLDIPPSNIEEI